MRTSHPQRTTLRAAFDNVKVSKSAYTPKGAIIGSLVAEALNTKAGISNELDWNAKLSMKTAQSLDAPNFNPVHKKIVNGQTVVTSVFHQRSYNTGTYNKMVH